MRRAIDLTVAIFCLILLSPMFLMLAILIKINSPGPILYAPLVVGQDGRVFSLLRFRTMFGTRLTPIGRFLRNYSLDHIPMLINLLKGDLTLIGPRPMEVQVVDWQDPIWRRYFQVKPGVFNYAVLKLGKLWTPGRIRRPSLNQELELDYLEQRSSRSDFYLLLHSLRAFIRSKGNIKSRAEPDAEVIAKFRKHSF